MSNREKKICTLLLFFLVLQTTLSSAQFMPAKEEYHISSGINYTQIITTGIQLHTNEFALKQWYNTHPQINSASLVKNTMTITFVDTSTILLLDVSSQLRKNRIDKTIASIAEYGPTLVDTQVSENVYTALLLNPSEHLYGNHHFKRIMNRLQSHGYSMTYLPNEYVDIPFLRYNLTTDIVYMNTHAGYWDINGNNTDYKIVIATGEYWTNQTQTTYQFEYENRFIVQGIIGDQSFVCFTPEFIQHYYKEGDMPESLIYMATCHATYDESMAQAFIAAGAQAYMGWTQETFFWINSKTSVIAFALFSWGFSLHTVCSIIRYGGLINLLLNSKLTYYGDRAYTLPHI